MPSLETITSGKYPVSRPLYLYVKGEHVGVVPGLPELDKEALAKACETFRQDVVVEISGDYTETLARLKANPSTIGVFGLSF